MPAPDTRLSSLVAVVSIGQIAGWGTTYYMPSVLAPELSRDLGLDATGIYLGITIMVAIGGLASPSVGRLLDQKGAARFMPIAPLAIGLGHLLVAALPSATTWYIAWVMHGLAMPMGLTLAVTTFLTRTTGAAARRSIGFLTLFVGFGPSLFWPLTALLDGHFGWRGTLAIYGVAELAVVLPLQLWIARNWSDRIAVPMTGGDTGGRPLPPPPALTPAARRLAIVAMVVLFTTQGFVAWGLPLHLITVFQDIGLGRTEAVAIAATSGIATIGARLVEITFGSRLRPLALLFLLVSLLAPAIALLVGPFDRTISAWIFIVVWNGSNGILAVLRMTLPLSLFGPAAYGTLMGRMSLPQNLSFAAAPSVLALVLAHRGSHAVLGVGIAMSVVALFAALVLVRVVRAARPAAPPPTPSPPH